MRKTLIGIPLFAVTFTVSTGLAMLWIDLTTTETFRTKRVSPVDFERLPVATVDIPPPTAQTSTRVDLSTNYCGPLNLDEEIPMRPIIRKWLRGERINEVPYCSKTGAETTDYSGLNLHPQFVDLNDDGIDELAVRYFCSPTGNCRMKIYQRIRKSYREIFSDRQMVNYFEKAGGSRTGFRDLRTRGHGSCCDGDQVIYRFNGKTYHPISCAEYSYWDGMNTGQISEKPVITKQPCSQMLVDPIE